MKKRALHYTGTINANRLNNAPLPSEKELKKEGRGHMSSVYETTNNLSLVRWLDNKCVTLISSYLGTEPVDNVKRYDKSLKKHIEVARPAIVKEYNAKMGGVDLLDMMSTLYKRLMKSRRWYMYIFFHMLTVSLVNSWFLYKRSCKSLGTKPMTMEIFQSQVAECLKKAGKPARGRPSSASPPVRKKTVVVPLPVQDVRYDKIDHLPDVVGTRGRCRLCPKGYSQIRCSKCGVYLCIVTGKETRNCFTAFHKL
ncbi:hypothetical protein SNE40_010841 [Patella caerulea]|uniref:PiggyBac transposable element-derived protein domain-containing protein n=1 Tax=Patella caerulea TaxID=87958 RepID=A0AAN8Q0P8_PATCE